jgi:hypothetical protein
MNDEIYKLKAENEQLREKLKRIKIFADNIATRINEDFYTKHNTTPELALNYISELAEESLKSESE